MQHNLLIISIFLTGCTATKVANNDYESMLSFLDNRHKAATNPHHKKTIPITRIKGTKNEVADGSQFSKPFNENENRLITIESWLSHLGIAVAFTIVQSDLIVFTRNDWGKPEKEIYRKSLSANELVEFHEAVGSIPKDLYRV
jgi:hypothetical protein